MIESGGLRIGSIRTVAKPWESTRMIFGNAHKRASEIWFSLPSTGVSKELLRRTRFCSFWLLNSAFISSVPQQPSSQFSFALRPRSSWLVLLPRLAQIECGPSWGRFPRSPPSLPAPPLERLVFHPVGSDKPDPLGKAERAAIFVVVATDGRATIEAVKAGARRGVLGDRFFRKRSVVARL